MRFVRIARLGTIMLLCCGGNTAASRAAEAHPQPAPGWTIELVAHAPQVSHPSVVATAPDGRVFVAEDPMDIRTAKASDRQGRILCLHPDGRSTVFADELHAVFGMQYLDGKLYVLHNPKLTVFRDDAGVGRDPVDLIASTNPEPWALEWNDHVPANFRLGMDGYFYLAVGDKGLFGCTGTDGRRVDLRGGGIVRLRPDGTGLEIFSTGVRNILDVAITSEDELFTYDNTDEQQWMSRVTHMVDGGFYGYPYDFLPRRPYTLWMMADYGGGAATGALAYTGDALPAEFRDNLFLADFGKRQILRLQIERSGGTFRVVRRTDLFTSVPDDFRPVGICQTADGRGFYLCDWQHSDTKEQVQVGRLWKLTYAAPSQAEPRPAWYVPAASGQAFTATNEDLLAGLSHADRDVRLTAQHRLAERGAAVVPALAALLSNEGAPTNARVHALWTLDAIDGGKSAEAAIVKLAESAAPALARQALRQLGTRASAAGRSAAEMRLGGTDPSLRYAAATALGHMARPESVAPLLDALADGDLFAHYAAFLALRRIGQATPKAWPQIVAALGSEQAELREGVRFALGNVCDVELAAALEQTLRDPTAKVNARASAVALLASIARREPAWEGQWWSYHPVNAPPPVKSEPWTATPEILAALRAAIEDQAPEVRLAAVEAAASTRDLAAASSLRGRLAQTDDPGVTAGVVRALAALGDRESVKPIAQLLSAQQTPRELALVVIDGLRQLGGDHARAALLEVLSSASDQPLHAKAVEALGAIGTAEDIAPLALLLNADPPVLRSEAIDALLRLETPAAVAPIVALLESTDQAARAAALAGLAHRPRREATPALLAAYQAGDMRLAAADALVRLSQSAAVDVYLDLLEGRDGSALREAARRAMFPILDEALPAVERRAATLSPTALAELQRIYERHEAARKGPLFAKAAATPSPDDFVRHALATAGDAARGKQIFADERGAACTRCHANLHVRPTPDTLGPDLTTIGAQFPRAALIEHVLFPNRSVREGYQATVVITSSGQVFTGLFRGETADEVLLADQDGKLQRIAKDDIDERTQGAQSLMPENLHTGLSLDDFAGLIAFLEACKTPPSAADAGSAPLAGSRPIFNGRDLSGWKIDDENRGHWLVRDGVLCHDGVAGDLWTEESFGDFSLSLEWRFPDQPTWQDHPLIGPDGWELQDARGRTVTQRTLDAGDSGVFLRGLRKAQANLFCYPVGSGEVWEYRTDPNVSEAVRRGVTPLRQADRPLGEWNQMTITVVGDRMTVELNGQRVIDQAQLPGLPERGPIGLQHEHGTLEFRNLHVRDLGTTKTP
jgi:putative membrane-bound dehydrogenase-like protein